MWRQRALKLTFKRREASVQNQLQVAQLPLGEHNSLQLLRLLVEFPAPGRIASDQILEDSAYCLSMPAFPHLSARSTYRGVGWPCWRM